MKDIVTNIVYYDECSTIYSQSHLPHFLVLKMSRKLSPLLITADLFPAQGFYFSL